MATRRRLLVPLLLVLSLLALAACEADDGPEEAAPATEAPLPSATPSPEPATAAPEGAAARRLESVFAGVRGYSFADGRAATRKRLTAIFRRNAPAPIEALTLKAVRRGGRPIPAMVLVAFFDVPRSELPEFHREVLTEIGKTYETAQPALDGLGVHFENPEGEAVAYPGRFGELVYVISPSKGLAIPLAEALVAAEPR